MRFGKIVLVSLSILWATPFWNSPAQSGRVSPPQPVATPSVDRNLSKAADGRKRSARDAETQKYKLIFPADAEFSGFVDQLNKSSEDGYRLRSAIYGWQHLSGKYYGLPVGILQLDETQCEYAWFEMTSKLFFALPGFEQKYGDQSKRGFRLVDHYLSGSSCAENNPDSVVPIQDCESSYLFLLEKEKGAHNPTDFVLAQTSPRWDRRMGEALTSQIREKLADGFYPTELLSSYQILLAHTTERADFEADTPDMQVITSSFLNDLKSKVNELGKQGFQLALIRDEAAVMYRLRERRTPVTYEWLNAKNKNFEKELERLQNSGAAYRMIYRDSKGGNQLVFEQGTTEDVRRREYKTLNLSFQMINPLALKHAANGKVQLDLTPASKETMKLINSLAGEGFVVRDLFVAEVVSDKVSILLERRK
jgi:hypothetical protein